MYDQQQGNSMRANGIVGAGCLAGQSAPKSDVQTAVDRLSNAIAAVGDRANLLHTRISPVLCAPGPASVGTSLAQNSSTAPLVDQLNRLADEVDGIRLNTIQDALDRLAV